MGNQKILSWIAIQDVIHWPKTEPSNFDGCFLCRIIIDDVGWCWKSPIRSFEGTELFPHICQGWNSWCLKGKIMSDMVQEYLHAKNQPFRTTFIFSSIKSAQNPHPDISCWVPCLLTPCHIFFDVWRYAHASKKLW